MGNPFYHRMLWGLVVFLWVAPNLVAQSLFLGEKAMVIMDGKDTNDFYAMQKTVTEYDGHVIHCFPPKIMQGYLTDQARQALMQSGKVKKIVTGRMDPAAEGLTGKEKMIANAWNHWHARQLAIRGEEDEVGEKDRPPMKAGRNETSEYMIGRVSVGIVFIESDGTLDPNTETWEDEDQEDLLHQIQKALEWWSEKGGYRASLSWTYEMRTVQTRYEPILHSSEDAEKWIQDVALKLGHGRGHHHDIHRNYANHLRDKYQTDWAFVIYAVNATQDEDGHWKGGGSVAWANLGGPLLVINNRCDGWGYQRVWVVVAHETGHIFNALDEYKGAANGNERHGLLKVINGNAEDGGVVRKSCIMKADETVLCEFTAGQIGWVDDNHDGIFESDYLNLSKKFNRKLARQEAEKFKAAGLTYKIEFISPWEEKNKKFYTEDFTRNTRSWPEDNKTRILNGRYMIDGHTPMPIWLPDVYSDFTLTVQVKWDSGEPTMGYSVDVYSSPSANVYSLSVTGDGYEAHNSASSGQSFERKYLPHKALKIKDWNTIKVVCKGDKISYFINNQLIYTFKDAGTIDRAVGYFVDPGVKISLDNLIISKE